MRANLFFVRCVLTWTPFIIQRLPNSIRSLDEILHLGACKANSNQVCNFVYICIRIMVSNEIQSCCIYLVKFGFHRYFIGLDRSLVTYIEQGWLFSHPCIALPLTMYNINLVLSLHLFLLKFSNHGSFGRMNKVASWPNLLRKVWFF